MSNQLESNVKKISEGLSGLTEGLQKYLNDAQESLVTPEDKKKFADALKNSNVMDELKKVTEQFKDVLK